MVDSILQQIERAGGRFLEKVSTSEDHLVVVSAKVSRLKVTHALRDKLPLNPVERAKIKLNELFKHHSITNEDRNESIYNLINAMIFHTSLHHYDHACSNHVEKVLSKIIIEFLEKIIDGRKESNKKAFVGYSTISSRIHEVENSERKNQYSLVDRVMMLASLASETKMKIPFDVEPQIESTSVEGSIKRLFNDERLEMEPIFVEDLPQGFTEDDCEQLVASLDNE